jgi:pimeloyl-ACP methyl ester carboxylesterase
MREFDSGEGWMNYVDEGEGRPVVFVHGCMTWSFLFRRMIEEIRESHRCIAPDHLGFGLSEKPPEVNYWPDGHARRFAMFMDQLNLRDITLVVHDAGAPIAFEWAAKNPDRIRDIVVMNSFMWDLQDNAPAMMLAKNIGNPMNKFYYRVLKATPSFILPPLFADRYRMSKAIQRQYLKPFETHWDRIGVYTMVESWKKSAPWYESVAGKLGSLKAKKTLLLWGTKDPMFGTDALERMQSFFPEARTIEFPESGRFLPEEQAERVTGEIQWFLMNSGTPSLALLEQLGG